MDTKTYSSQEVVKLFTSGMQKRMLWKESVIIIPFCLGNDHFLSFSSWSQLERSYWTRWAFDLAYCHVALMYLAAVKIATNFQFAGFFSNLFFQQVHSRFSSYFGKWTHIPNFILYFLYNFVRVIPVHICRFHVTTFVKWWICLHIMQEIH